MVTVQFPTDHIIERARDTTLRAPVYVGATLTAPSEGICTVRDEAGAVVATGAVTVAASVATFTVTAAVTTGRRLSESWTVEWDLTVAGDRHVAVNVARLCRHRLYPCITTVDITSAYRALDGTQPDAVTALEDLTPYIRDAMYEVEDRLIQRGRRSELVLSPSSLRRPLRHLAVSNLLDDLAARGLEVYAELAQRQRDRYEAVWGELTFRYDADQDGRPDPGRVTTRTPLWAS